MAYNPLSLYCDTPHTQQLMALYGDRLQHLDRSDLLDLITTFAAACNQPDESNHSEYTFQQYVSDMDLVVSVEMDSILEILDGFDSQMNSALLLGLAAMNHDRGN